MADVPVDTDSGADGVEPNATGVINKRLGSDDGRSALKDWIGLLIRAACWALLIYVFIFQVSIVDGPSMQPNFQQSDRLVIDKLTYRIWPVKRFDVVVFQAVEVGSPNRVSRDYIKRVIGLPGETVKIVNGWIFINDGKTERRLEEEYGPTVSHNFFAVDESANTWVVPRGHYFVLGDNRPQSKDSRLEAIGFVPKGQIKGLVRLRFWPRGSMTWFKRAETD